MRLDSENGTTSVFTTLASFALIAAVLRFADAVFIPIALAGLLSFLLTPLVVRLARWGLGKVLSIIVAVTFAFTLIGVIGWLVLAQTVHLVEQLPKYQQNLHAKVVALKKPNRVGLWARASHMMTQLSKDLESLSPANEGAPGAVPTPESERPVPVEIKPLRPNPIQLVGSLVGPVIKPIAVSAAVVFLVVLMLSQREDLRERFLKLVSGGELNVATQAVDDATQRVSRYLLMQLVVNGSFGVPIGVGLYFIGVPNAFLWGLLATVLRFIPFLGIWIAASFPLILAFAVDPGWLKLLLCFGLFGVVEVLCNNLIEPCLYGASTGVSNLALLTAAVFWTWLWGPVGLLLSTPLTVCLLVIGKYVPGLAFLNVLLGSEPALEPDARFYQRMLAMDDEELLQLSEKYVQEHSLVEFYESILLPALSLAEQDRHKGALAELRQAFIVQNTRELIEILSDAESEGDNAFAADAVSTPAGEATVLCLPVKDEADELAAVILEKLLAKRGIPAQALSAKLLDQDWATQIRRDRVRAVCLSGIPPFAVNPARTLYRRVKRTFPELPVIIGIWNSKAQPTELANRLGPLGQEIFVTRLTEAVSRFEAILQTAPPPGVHLVREHAAGALPGPRQGQPPDPEEVFDAVTRQTAKLLDVPVSLVSLVGTDEEFWRAHGGMPSGATSGNGLRESSLYTSGQATAEILDVEDLSKDTRFAKDAFFQDRGIRFYASVPLRTSDGHVVGTLCATDSEPHQVTEEAKTRLRVLAQKLITAVEQRNLALNAP